MKKLWSILLLFIVTTTAHAGLFINNNTDRDMSLATYCTRRHTHSQLFLLRLG